MEIMFPDRPSQHIVMLSGFTKKDQENMHMKISSLGGLLLDSEHFVSNCTHVICKTLTRTEKFLGACAMGKWILHESFIYDSYSIKCWLDEEKYEWGPNISTELIGTPSRQYLLSAPRECRLAYKELSQHPFAKWKVALICNDTNESVYRSLLKWGGAVVLPKRSVFSSTDFSSHHLTHLIVKEQQMCENKEILKLVKQLRNMGVSCVKKRYIRDYLTSFPKPDVDQYLLPRGYMSHCSESTVTSQKKSTCLKILSKNNQMPEKAQLSNHSPDVSISNKIKSNPETSTRYSTQRPDLKQITLLSPAKSSVTSPYSHRQRKKTKVLQKPDPNQPLLTDMILKITKAPTSSYKSMLCIKEKPMQKNLSPGKANLLEKETIEKISISSNNQAVKTSSRQKQKRIVTEASKQFAKLKKEINCATESGKNERIQLFEHSKADCDTEVQSLSENKSSSADGYFQEPSSLLHSNGEKKPTDNQIGDKKCEGQTRPKAAIMITDNVSKGYGLIPNQDLKFCNMWSWLPNCSLNQCHDVSEKVDLQQPSRVTDAVLEVAMEDEDGWFSFQLLSVVQSRAALCYYIPSKVLSHLMRKILWFSPDQRQANTAYSTLCHILELYPPTTPALQKLHLESLRDFTLTENQLGAEWTFVENVIYDAIMNSENQQHQYNSYLLLKYIVTLLQKNFSKYYTRHIKHGNPIIATIIWHDGYRMMNDTCVTLITLLVDAVQLDRLPKRMEIVELLQSVIAMVAHCLAFRDPSVCCQDFTEFPLVVCLFATRLAHIINDTLTTTAHLKLILNSMMLPWLVFLVTKCILDMYGNSLFSSDSSQSDKRLKSLRTLLDYYLCLIPPSDGDVKYPHFNRQNELYTNSDRKVVNAQNMACWKTGKKCIYNMKMDPKVVQQQNSRTLGPRAADVNKRNCKGEICSRKVDIFVRGGDGISVLHNAVINNHIDVATVLIHRGGEDLVAMKTNAGQTSLDLATSDEMRVLLQKANSLASTLKDNSLLGDTSYSDSLPVATKISSMSVLTDDGYKVLQKQGYSLSSSQCSIYILLVYLLIISYIKYYDLNTLIKTVHGVDQTHSVGDRGVYQGHVPEVVYENLRTMKQMKNDIDNFEVHLKRLCTSFNTNELSLLRLMGNCFAED